MLRHQDWAAWVSDECCFTEQSGWSVNPEKYSLSERLLIHENDDDRVHRTDVNERELKRRFPNATESFIKANLNPESSGSDSVVECNPVNGSSGEDAREGEATGKFHIRFISVRKRLCDPDNLAVKWLLDCLRYAQIIPDDSPDKISLEVTQRKCKRGRAEKEHTLIEITNETHDNI